MDGYVHSLESFGTVDGPGVRFVVFFQGCPMRCQYCHNPDTWKMQDGTLMTADEIIERLERNKSFYATGGITATGGEPMLQMDFLTDLFQKAKERGIATCLDTSGICFPIEGEEKAYDTSFQKLEQLMQVTDLVMLDIKHIKEDAHRELTGHSNQAPVAFARYLHEIHKAVWIRHVVVPEITFQAEELRDLGIFLKEFDNVEKIELLPYHAMGKVKYDQLGIAYPLEKTRQLKKEEIETAWTYLNEGLGKSSSRFYDQK